jgi:hypothetical protein
MVDKLPSLNWFIFKKTSLKLMARSLEFVSVGNPAGSPGSSRRDDGPPMILVMAQAFA